MLMMALLMVLGIGLLSLSTIELRRSQREDFSAMARANARLALTAAIGQLQTTCGPDQRVTATAELLGGSVAQPHWTGVWRTTAKDGSPLLKRDDLKGGLSDVRWTAGFDRGTEVLEWLVSGEGDPAATDAADMVPLVGSDESGAKPLVEAPKVDVAGSDGEKAGHYAWWTGDLGVRANLSTADPRAAVAADVSSPQDGGLYRVMASQAADIEVMDGGRNLEPTELQRLASPASAGLTSLGKAWSDKHQFDFTVESSGVLADAAGGGLKRDLTAYLESGGTVPEINGLPGLTDQDALVGVEADARKTAVSARHSMASPRFGVLRDWAKLSLPFRNAAAPAKLPELDPSGAAASRTLALANESAVKLTGNVRTGLQPVLVEATNYTQWGTYLNGTSTMNINGTQRSVQMYQLRTIMYPRVVFWNPYNVELQSDRLILMIQGNGRQEMWTQNENVNQLPAGWFRPTTSWISFEGGRSIDFGPNGFSMNSEGYNDPYMGSYFFVVPATQFKPGECLVFSPPSTAEYDGRSVYRPGAYNLNKNVLSCEVAPDPARCYYVSGSDIDDEGDGGINFLPKEFWMAPSNVRNQSDDTRVIVKSVGNASTVTFETFDALPQVAVVSASLQYGAGREARISWNKNERMPMELSSKVGPKFTIVPNVRTRESIRLRWFEEHPSNQLSSGPLAGTPHFQDALLANWNPRAAYTMRSPWENIAGTGGGPWFFGAYTRDLFDQAVSWQDQAPVPRGGRYHGNPFGPPQEGNGRYILFDVPRSETGVVSLAQFQHAKLSELVWHPSSPIGNSLADPRLGSGGYGGLAGTAATGSSAASSRLGGFHETDIGWSTDSERAKGRGDWATTGRAMLANTPASDNLVYDLSFEVNRNLWDRFYLSTGSTEQKSAFIKDPLKNPLPNSRMRLAPATRSSATPARLNHFHQAAYQLMLDGAFNVNSTRVEAWKALLSSTRRVEFGDGGGVPFPRILGAPGGAWKSGNSPDGDQAWDGYRVLTDEEVSRLAEAIVEQVKLRGPFISLADFVNRRLAENDTGRMGALQAAIENAGLNASHIAAYPLDNRSSLPNYRHPDNISDATRMEQTLKPSSKAWGAPTYLTQADVLQVIGPALSARSDTFVIRTYGDAVDESGNIQARAWCEATVQRTPEPVEPDESGLNPKKAGQPGDFGRRIRITSFRWLNPDEV
jgi:hypothetical protein